MVSFRTIRFTSQTIGPILIKLLFDPLDQTKLELWSIGLIWF